MMTGRKRAGFTLVELLVVIVIISMLVGLLVPATLRAREAARRGKCVNNQKEIAQASLHYDTATGHLPGVVNALGPVTQGTWQLDWVVVLLSGLGREDAWNNWKLNMTGQGSGSGSTNQLWMGTLPQMICPSSDPNTTSLSYVANCGSSDATSTANFRGTTSEFSAGVILDYYNVPNMPRMTASNIKDGAAQTLMYSENLQAGLWMGGAGTGKTNDPNPWNGTGAVKDYLVGMFWSATPTDANHQNKSTPPINCSGINACRSDTPTLPTDYPPVAADYLYARPSSNHPGVVVVTYCDGHQDVLSEDIAYGVYVSLMCPDDVTVGVPTLTPPP